MKMKTIRYRLFNGAGEEVGKALFNSKGEAEYRITMMNQGIPWKQTIWLLRRNSEIWAVHEKWGERWKEKLHSEEDFKFHLPFPISKVKEKMASNERIRPPLKMTLTYSSEKKVGIEKIIRFRSFDRKKLFGVLETPKKPNSRHAIILIHGSGKETGDSGSGYEGRDYERCPSQPFREISRKLVAKGFPVFRYDKRGVGRSQGNFDRVTRTDLMDDLLVAIELVAKRSKQPVILFGFSEGSNLAISAAKKSKYVRAIALAGSPARSIDKVILAKLHFRLKKYGDTGQQIRSTVSNYKTVFDHVRSLKLNNNYRSTRFLGYSIVWWAEHIRHAPAQEVKQVHCPVLLLHGSQDAEVLVEECEMLSRALAAAKVPHKKVIFKGLNHFFTPACSENPGFEYEIPYEIPERFFEKFSRWADRL